MTNNPKKKKTINDDEWARFLGDEPANDAGENKNSDADDPNKTGYRRPPKEHQFKKGQSGNPKGRPKGITKADSDRELRAMIHRAAMRPTNIKIDGKIERVSLAEAAYIRIFNDGATGKSASQKLGDKILYRTIKEHEEYSKLLFDVAQTRFENVRTGAVDQAKTDDVELALIGIEESCRSISGEPLDPPIYPQLNYNRTNYVDDGSDD